MRLHSRIHETVKYRTKSPEKRREWEQACAEFHARYEGLAFPGGYRNALERISRSDPEAMEAAICFLGNAPILFSLRLHVQSNSSALQTGTANMSGKDSYGVQRDVTSEGGGISRCFIHSMLILWFFLSAGICSRLGIKICKPASGVILVYPFTS